MILIRLASIYWIESVSFFSRTQLRFTCVVPQHDPCI
jgi:hypothetical protein